MKKIIGSKNFIFISLIVILVLGIFLRLYKLGINPVSLFGDELDVGYQALSLLKTGKDYSGNFLPLHFQSLAEWRTPLYIYASIPTVAIFGISPWGVRLPAVFFGVLGILVTYLLVKKMTGDYYLGLVSAFLLTILPWHILYSRAGFEVTMLYTFFFGGILFFLYGLEKNFWLIPSAILLGFTPWIYSTAKLFLPLAVVGLFFIWRKKISKVRRNYLFVSLALFLLITIPFAVDTLSGRGTERFNSISIFDRPTLTGEVGELRVRDSQMGGFFSDSVFRRVFHNKIVIFSNIFLDNYFKSLSPEFLFTQGDPSPRQNSAAAGGFYAFEAAFIIIGLCFVFIKKDKFLTEERLTVLFFLFASPIPGALTQGGGNHATRQFLLIFPLTFLAAVGLFYLTKTLKGRVKIFWLAAVALIIFWSFINYFHYFFVHYPWDSQKWWQAGFREMVSSAIVESKDYDSVIISSAGEPALKFFLAWSGYPPADFQKVGTRNMVELQGIGQAVKLDKFLFPPVGESINLYNLASVLPSRTLYVATTEEVLFDLEKEPERIPGDLKLIKVIRYPSGEPAFYLLTKR